MHKKEYSIDIGGRTMTAEFNDWADQANGSVILKYGNSTVLATAVMGERESAQDYFPLSVEYEEKFYAAGAILGSQYMRREGRPSEEAVLGGRIVDRTIRPLFEQHIRRDVQVIVSVLSLEENDTDVMGVIAASLALATSDIPWNGPVGAVRMGRVGGSLVVNPTYAQRDDATNDMDLLLCGKDGMINMIEVAASQVGEIDLVQGMEEGLKTITALQKWQEGIVAERGLAKQSFPKAEVPAQLLALFASSVVPQLETAIFGSKDGVIGKENINQLKKDWMKAAKEMIKAELPDVKESLADHYFEEKIDEHIHVEAIKNGRRADGRGFEEIRALYAQAGGISPVIHGTGVFYRGGTHVMSALTLGGPGDAQTLDTIEHRDAKKHFMHHYNFPPYSVGETGRMGGTNRRMIGHGALAEKALRAVLPEKTAFPYTIRIVSECLASNGSTSMGSVCAGTLALMDAGVPIKNPVAGMAMGLMSDDDHSAYKILTDIQGPEDHFGDMDFKVAGTKDGVTAVQMDVKVAGIPLKVLAEAFEQAKKARMEVLEVITQAIPAPRADISARAPKILTLKVLKEQIGLVIGPGGKTINGIREKTKVDDITIEEDGTVFITGRDGSAEAAKKEIFDLTREYLPGEKFQGVVTRLMDFGAFVKIGPNAEGLVHVSEMAPFRVARVSDVLAEGDIVPVIIKEIDEKKRINLSIKDVDPQFAEKKGVSPSTQPPQGNNYGSRPNRPNRSE